MQNKSNVMETIKIEEMEIEFWKQHPNSSCKCVVKITNTQTDDSVTLRDTQALQLASAINEAFGDWVPMPSEPIREDVWIKENDNNVTAAYWSVRTGKYLAPNGRILNPVGYQPITKPRP